MTTNTLRQFRFATPEQWRACLFSTIDANALSASHRVRPMPAYAPTGVSYASAGARLPIVLHTGEILWCDDCGLLHRASTLEAALAPAALAQTERVVSTAGQLWAISAERRALECFDDETLSRLNVVDFESERLIDIAYADRRGIFVLVEHAGGMRCDRVNDAGKTTASIAPTGVNRARSFIYLRSTKQFVVLTDAEHASLLWYSAEGGRPVASMPVAALSAGFKAAWLAGNATDKFVVAGADPCARASTVFVVDAGGNALGRIAPDVEVRGIAANARDVIVATKHGLRLYATSAVVPVSTDELRCVLITPMLVARDRAGLAPWLRVDATAHLPEGTALEIKCFATDDQTLRNRLNAIAQAEQVPASFRIQELLLEMFDWTTPVLFKGDADNTTASPTICAAPLFDVRQRYVWVCVTLTASRGARLPSLSRLDVLYPGRSLIEDLPTPYRRAAAQPGSYLRSLVGVLEATTQELEASIAGLGSRIHPATATEPWMDYLARWFDLPWDEALSPEQKRALLQHAPELTKGRGTRVGLETLLACLLPGSPRRFRVTDPTAEFGFAIVGGAACAGSALPALLGGYSQWHSELNSHAVLGRVRLPCAGQRQDPAARFAGAIRVDVAATANERQILSSLLRPLIAAMIPLSARVNLRWISARALRGAGLGANSTLEAPPKAVLDSESVVGRVRLPNDRKTLLTESLSIGTRLR